MAVVAHKNFAMNKSYSIEHGYPSRRRSLVEDSKFETMQIKQAKESALEQARQRANGESDNSFFPDEHTDIDNKSGSSSDEGIDSSSDCSSSTVGKKDQRSRKNDPDVEEPAVTGIKDESLTEEEMIISNEISESKEAKDVTQKTNLILNFKGRIEEITEVIKFKDFNATIEHMDTRKSNVSGCTHDLFFEIEISRPNLLRLLKKVKQNPSIPSFTILDDKSHDIKAPWFPKHPSDLDFCNHLINKVQPDLDQGHPGFYDKVYRSRREEITNIAYNFKYGDIIPDVDYSESETSTWTSVYNTVKDLIPKHACKEYRDVFSNLEQEGLFSPNRIPQLREMNAYMKKRTGFQVRPAGGLLTARDFLASLALKYFQSTQYVRHHSSPYHTPEPDCIHELLGHMPLLADPTFAKFSQFIGLTSLGESDKQIEKLSTVYWFTVEFGLCKEGNEVKAYGAGLLSSYGELLHAISDKPEHRPFVPCSTSVQPYQDQEYQPIYYVAESFKYVMDQIREWMATESTRKFDVWYNSETETIEILDSSEKISELLKSAQEMVDIGIRAMNKILRVKV